ncbi:calcium-translocating P-type ATPase, PMCA-type [Prevotella sp. KH2C16]|uniref:calcium-translocating P-type ATPase, PMCA-type n=1 Tax=Prevotella sp. KH2C16 TaxID=1855325 RepID=UPI0008F15F16|nr:calcium-translocating P-type ATPase, PMCA-type [Prevotella sp. KH2C16]SFF81796.1 Ca2+-transporting ATPase [Prevotella sp. KH2C16]
MEEKQIFEADPQTGLSWQEADESRRTYGRNLLTPPRHASLWKLYLDKYRDPIIQILLVAAAISLVLAFIENDFIEVIGILIAIFLATTIAFYFERDASRKFDMLAAMGEEQSVKVRREGKVMEIPRKDVVVGDIVLIETGDEVPADGLLLESVNLQIDESSLTGEPIVDKFATPQSTTQETTYPANMALRSTMVMGGRGVLRVTAVGDRTEIGKVAIKSTETIHTKTPLNMQLDKLASLISKIGSGVAVAAFVIFLVHDILTNTILWHGDDYMLMAKEVLGYFMMAVTLIVMAVPEGLPMAVTLALALNMRRMLKSNNLVRKLHACETMGAVTVICTDKTGTLTQNKMRVAEVVEYGDTSLLALAIAANSTAELDGDDGIGNPTEAALLLWLRQQGFDYRKLREENPVFRQEPFSTEKKYMSTTIMLDGKEVTFTKGAPEILLAANSTADNDKKQAFQRLEAFQKAAMRTLAFSIDGKLQAIAAINDPVREDVPKAVKNCQNAGIEIKIVTGDTAATAAEIGYQIGIVNPEADSGKAYITGVEWENLSDEEALDRSRYIKIMSRARPTDKQRLVEMLQKRGEIVAVTGDGTNDAPALHYAHVGLSLGSGTSVAKEASDMTLLDDSFASIANAVMWGRSLYKNIQRFLFFQLVVNLTALLLVLGGSVIGTELPLTVTQILWVNLIMDTFAAMALASLPPSREVMKEKPRKQGDFIITKSMAWGIVFVGLGFFAVLLLFLMWCERNGSGTVDIHELTLFFTTFVMLQFWNLFNAKTLGSRHSAFHNLPGDRGMLFVMLLILAGQWLIVTFGGKMFRTVPLSLEEWLIIIAATSAILWIGELYRLLSPKRRREEASR